MLNIKQNWYEKPYLEGLTSFIYELLLSCGSREKKGMGRKDAPGNRFSRQWNKESKWGIQRSWASVKAKNCLLSHSERSLRLRTDI